MRITISPRLRPFVHRPGVPMVLPGTGLVAVPYPTHIELADRGQLSTGVCGPVTRFTVCQDLEQGRLSGWGKGANGEFRWDLYATPDRKGVVLCSKAPKQAVFCPTVTERLSLGCHRKQDWDLVLRRLDLCEILPVWLRLGQLTPPQPLISGMSLLTELQEVIADRRREHVAQVLLALLRTGFEGVMVPQETDALHWGYSLPPVPRGGSPLALLTLGAALVRSLFVHDSGDTLAFLKLVPRELVSGRLTGLRCRFGELDLEWSKRALRRVVLRVSQAATLQLDLGRDIRYFRVRRNKGDKGTRLDAKAMFAVSENEVLWLDRFEK